MTFVQQAGSSPGTATAPTQAFASDNAAAALLLCLVTWDTAGGRVISTVTDSKGNTWSLAKFQDDTTNLQGGALYYAPNAAAGPNTVTVTFNGSALFTGLIVAEYSGISTASPVDGTPAGQTASGTTATDNVTSTATTTTQGGGTIIGAVVDTDGSSTLTPGTGFTQRGTSQTSGLSLEDLVQGSAGAVSATWTRSVAGRYACIVAAFKASGATPAIPIQRSAVNQAAVIRASRW